VFFIMQKPKNIIEKIWGAHIVSSTPGFPDIFAIDLQLVHEVTSPQAFAELRDRNLPIHNPAGTIATIDHNVSTAKNRLFKTPTTDSEKQITTLRKNCQDFNVKLLDMESGMQGIVHVVGPEQGITQPGMTIVCGDSHTSTHGAFGAIAFGVGTTEVGHVMATGCILREKPKTMLVKFEGQLGQGITSKDLILKLIQQIGVGGATGHIIEYAGEAIETLSMEQRLTICNMSIECGARAGLVAPDQITFDYIKGRTCAPTQQEWKSATTYWQSLRSDANAEYDKIVTVDINNMAPVVTWGFNPAQSISIDQNLPATNPEIQKAYDYVKLTPETPLEGTPIDYVFIGSCTNARIEDFRAAAQIMQGKKVANNVTAYVVPGSEQVLEQCIAEGLDKIFKEAGAPLRNPGCSMCLAMNADKVPEGKRCASTSNRNFVGRQGKGSITHLMSPIMAAAAAVEGAIVDVRKYL
jgi:3-isopropylmalate/(R)-2-methylmalate dehydratase large subunit